jgi:hypothetical protein
VSSKLHTLLQFIGLDPKCYKDHSFRIGAATNTVNMGFSQQYIRKNVPSSESKFHPVLEKQQMPVKILLSTICDFSILE